MTSPNASRPGAQGFARRFRLRVFGAIGVLALLMVASTARADAVDDADRFVPERQIHALADRADGNALDRHAHARDVTRHAGVVAAAFQHVPPPQPQRNAEMSSTLGALPPRRERRLVAGMLPRRGLFRFGRLIAMTEGKKLRHAWTPGR